MTIRRFWRKWLARLTMQACPLEIYVDGYSGHRANERPRQFTVDEDVYEIAAIEDQWRSPGAIFFKVRSTEGKEYLLRYDERKDEWTLQRI